MIRANVGKLKKKKITAAAEAFRAFSRGHRQPFASRGDDSGTSRRTAPWRKCFGGLRPDGAVYAELGQRHGPNAFQFRRRHGSLRNVRPRPT